MKSFSMEFVSIQVQMPLPVVGCLSGRSCRDQQAAYPVTLKSVKVVG